MDTPLLCVTVTAPTMAELRKARDHAALVADLVELRLDGVRDADAEAAIAGRSRPVIVTCRPRREGGAFDGAEVDRLGILERAASLGAEYVDVEWDSSFQPLLAARSGRGIVLSSHDFAGVPRDLADRSRAMLGAGAEVVKIAVAAESLADNLALLGVGREAAGGARLALVAMGQAGLPSRLLAAHFGSCWSYSGDGVAPGQVPPDRMLSEFRFRRVTRSTRIFGVVGRPIGHSVSPAIHNAAFDAAGFDGVYIPLAAQNAADFKAFADAVGLAGASITAPFKLPILEHAAEIDDATRTCGAANTLRVEGGKWSVRNTDVAGFLDPLDSAGVDLPDARVAVIGTGGAARAVVAGLGLRHARTTVYGRRQAPGDSVAAISTRCTARVGLPEPGSWDVLVNATPVGTWPDVEESPVDSGALAGGGLVYDLVYNPAETALLRAARAAGCRTIQGVEMLVSQAVRQFEWWTGTRAPRDVMRRAAVDGLRRMAGAA